MAGSNSDPASRRLPSSQSDSLQSPTDTRQSSSRYESITSDDDQPIYSHRQAREARTYGTLSGDGDTEEQTEADRQHPSHISSSKSSIRHQVLSPDRPDRLDRPKKPTISRRGTSQAQRPHRGQEFSADDDPEEVEKKNADRQGSVAAAASGRGTLRRKPSTLRRRGTAQPTTLPRVESSAGEDEEPGAERSIVEEDETVEQGGDGEETTVEEGDENLQDEDNDSDISDAESFTLKDRQDAINETHPFGIRIWKPALYKKSRSVQKTAEGDIHSSPGGRVSKWLVFFNILWTVLFGWWLALAALCGAIVCFLFAFHSSSIAYGRVLLGLAGYVIYPFGKFVKLEQDEAYLEEDEGEGRSISEYEQWQSGDLEDGRLFFGPVTNRSLIGRRRDSMESAGETDSLLGRTRGDRRPQSRGGKTKRRLFGRGDWNLGRVIFFVFFYGLITPLLLMVSGICWLMVFWIPMGKVTMLLFYHLRRHPLALSFHSDGAYSRGPGPSSSSVLLCTYRAVGLNYWKYTIDGTNIFLINLMGVVLFVIFDYWVLGIALGLKFALTQPGFIFTFSLLSIIPLAYFIGQAVASISAQSSMGVGAAINAFFSTVVEVFLYCVALNQGKGRLVEGSIIGSIFAGVLFLPGLSMCFGAIKRKTQRFNAKSAGVTSTMLLFAVIAAFGPTLFYQIYGTHELNCLSCVDTLDSPSRDCRRCYFSQVPAVTDRFFIEAVRPYCWFAAVLLFLSYCIGLWFTLRTHAAVIWESEENEKKGQGLSGSMHGGGPGHYDHNLANGSAANGILTRINTLSPTDSRGGHASVRESQLYKRILNQSLKQSGAAPSSRVTSGATITPNSPHMVPPKSSSGDSARTEGGSSIHIPGFSQEQDQNLVREVAEMAATAATVAARDVVRAPRKTSIHAQTPAGPPSARLQAQRSGTFLAADPETEALPHSGGHDAPNWSRTKSSVILLGATLLYAVIAEILVNTVDVVLESVDIDEKFLGITLFALVPNTTEFLNAISFAMNGNIALSMEIGSAYALQVCLLQVPALVLFSAVHGRFIEPSDLIDHTFSLIFPQFDMVTVILCVFLLSYMYGEGKSNYFKGSILILSYLVVMMGFYLSGFTDAGDLEGGGPGRFDLLGEGGQFQSFKTVGRGRRGQAW
ncbi:MAG: hypothetical protein M1817_002842 [Caeruleum heppii]|nr:MAG: hypothetical protein M1817_002842 [Caeruleum heppii]